MCIRDRSNVNTLIPHKCIGKFGFCAPYKGVMCTIRRVDGLDDNMSQDIAALNRLQTAANAL